MEPQAGAGREDKIQKTRDPVCAHTGEGEKDAGPRMCPQWEEDLEVGRGSDTPLGPLGS